MLGNIVWIFLLSLLNLLFHLFDKCFQFINPFLFRKLLLLFFQLELLLSFPREIILLSECILSIFNNLLVMLSLLFSSFGSIYKSSLFWCKSCKNCLFFSFRLLLSLKISILLFQIFQFGSFVLKFKIKCKSGCKVS